MQITQLVPIVKMADKRAIESELRKLGYINCKKHPILRHTSLVALANGRVEETPDGVYYTDRRQKLGFDGRIITDVENYEQYIFVVVNVYDMNKERQIDMYVFAKEQKNAKQNN